MVSVFNGFSCFVNFNEILIRSARVSVRTLYIKLIRPKFYPFILQFFFLANAKEISIVSTITTFAAIRDPIEERKSKCINDEINESGCLNGRTLINIPLLNNFWLARSDICYPIVRSLTPI